MSAIHNLAHEHLEAVLALNAAHEAETSALTRDALERLVEAAFSATAIGAGTDAFLIAFDEAATYDSPNYLWFQARYDRFVYVDRIIVAGHARGRGLARLLYEDLFSRTRHSGRDLVACEVNLRPPNPGSDAFHAALGFVEAGRGDIHGGAKTVRYLTKSLTG